MLTKLHSKVACLALALAATALFVVPSAQASPVDYDFAVNVTSGPLLGTPTSSGSFSYDTSSIVTGGYITQVGLLTALHFSFNGIGYNASTANTGYLGFDSTGNLTSFVIGSNCGYNEAVGYETCTVQAGSDQWSIATVNGFLGSAFTYSTSNSPSSSDGFAYGTVSFSQVDAPPVASVPEPDTLGMFGFGALLLGVFVRRRRHAG